jgi:hypothetical protein
MNVPSYELHAQMRGAEWFGWKRRKPLASMSRPGTRREQSIAQ